MKAPAALPRRTFWYKVLIFGLLLQAFSGGLRLQQALTRWTDLLEAGLQPGPLYLVVTGALLCASALWAFALAWQRRPRFSIHVGAFVLVWTAWDWIDRLWISSSSTVLANWQFALAATILILVFVFLVLRREERRIHEYQRARD